jgi:quercetin dioxygenase-like cupin family protein
MNYFSNWLSMKHLKTLTVSATIVLSFVSPASAAKTKESVITKSWDDNGLKWGPAPAFMPQGTELSVLHGVPSKKNVDAFFRVQPKATIPSHWHTSAERMILVAGELHVSYKGQEKIILKTGSYAYGPAKLPHEAFCASEIPCVLFIAFEAPVDAFPATKASK